MELFLSNVYRLGAKPASGYSVRFGRWKGVVGACGEQQQPCAAFPLTETSGSLPVNLIDPRQWSDNVTYSEKGSRKDRVWRSCGVRVRWRAPSISGCAQETATGRHRPESPSSVRGRCTPHGSHAASRWNPTGSVRTHMSRGARSLDDSMELYDLEEDPFETTDVAEAHPSVVSPTR